MTKFGHQPARAVVADMGLTVNEAAERVGENYSHFRNALLGIVSPCRRLRERLPELTRRPLTDLFTEDSLASEYGAGKRGQYSASAPIARRSRRRAPA